jgi:cob(I)alamin adenosyltransferase
MNEVLPEMRFFILPGGHVTVSNCHIARCVCRRAERHVIHLNENEFVNEIVIKYLNRLSDYLFVLARFLGHSLQVNEIPWNPRM